MRLTGKNGNKVQLSDDQSKTVQAGWNAFQGQKTNNGQMYPKVSLKDDNGHMLNAYLYYIGSDKC